MAKKKKKISKYPDGGGIDEYGRDTWGFNPSGNGTPLPFGTEDTPIPFGFPTINTFFSDPNMGNFQDLTKTITRHGQVANAQDALHELHMSLPEDVRGDTMIEDGSKLRGAAVGLGLSALITGQQSEAEYLRKKANEPNLTPIQGFYGNPNYKSGGSVGEIFSLNFPNHFDSMRNTLNSGNRPAVPIQTEKGEVIASPFGDLVKVGARTSHDKMKDTDVTDVTAEGNYIFSKTKTIQFKKGGSVEGVKLDDIVFDWTAPYYQEGKLSNKVREIKFMDLAPNKKKFTPAEFADNIRKKFPVTDRKDDAFAKSAIDKNKEARMPYIQTLQELSDMKKPDKFNTPQFTFGGGIMSNMSSVLNPVWNQPYDKAITGTMYPQDPLMNMLNKQDNASIYKRDLFKQPTKMSKTGFFNFKNGGRTQKYVPQKFLGPLAVLGIGAGLGLLGGLGKGLGGRKTINRLEDYYFDTTNPALQGYLGESRDIGMMGALANRAILQNPTLDPELATGAERQKYARAGLNAQLREMAKAQRFYENSLGDMYSLGRLNPRMAPAYAAASLRDRNAGLANLAGQTAGLYGNYYNTLFGLSGDTAGQRQNYSNTLTDFLNQANSSLIGGITGAQQNYLQGMSNLALSDYNVKNNIAAMRLGNQQAATQTGVNAMGAVTAAGMPFASSSPGNVTNPATGQFGHFGSFNSPYQTGAYTGYGQGIGTPLVNTGATNPFVLTNPADITNITFNTPTTGLHGNLPRRPFWELGG